MAMLAAAGLHARVHAQEKPPLWLEADACPSAELVRTMLEPLVGHQRAVRLAPPHAEAEVDPTLRAAVRDHGDQYVIEIAGVERSQPDAQRDCRERARVAAVFIALNVQAPPPPAQPAPVAAQPTAPVAGTPLPTPPAPAPDPDGVQFGLGGHASVAYAPRDQVAPGGALELWMRRGILQVGLRAGAQGKVALEISPSEPGGRAALLRLPTALFAGALWRISRFELGPAAGLAVDVLRAEGQGLSRSEATWRANLGAYLALQGQLTLTNVWSLAALASGSFYPRAYTLQVDPDQREAHTPKIWLGGQLGVLCRLR